MITAAEMKEDYDWQSAFNEALNGDYLSRYEWEGNEAVIGPVEHVVEVYSADAGQNDEADWVCIGKWDDDRYFVMAAGCDYTGWD